METFVDRCISTSNLQMLAWLRYAICPTMMHQPHLSPFAFHLSRPFQLSHLSSAYISAKDSSRLLSLPLSLCACAHVCACVRFSVCLSVRPSELNRQLMLVEIAQQHAGRVDKLQAWVAVKDTYLK